ETETLAVPLLGRLEKRARPAGRSGRPEPEEQQGPHGGVRLLRAKPRRRRSMARKSWALAAAAVVAAAAAVPAEAQNEQFIPRLVYRTGPYAPNGIPFANGAADYLNLINERDGGINGVKIVTEVCETGYATDKGVECYERPKNKGPTGAD